MLYSSRTRKRITLVLWLCLLLMLSSVLSTVPTAAQGATPDATTEQESSDSALPAEGEESGDTEPVTVESVTIECSTSGGSVVGSFTVVDPSDGVIVELQLVVVGSTIVRVDETDVYAGQTDYPFEIALASDDVAYGNSVQVTASDAAFEDELTFSNEVAIAATADGVTTCGTVSAPTETTEPLPTETTEPAPTETTEPVPTEETPTETTEPVVTETIEPIAPVVRSATTATTTPSATATASPRATTTPTATTGSGTVVNTGGAGLRCRDAASTSGRVITTLAEGSKVTTRGAASNGWVPVTCGGKNGWVSASYFKVAGSSSPSSTPVTTAATYGVVVNTGGANLRCRTAPVTGATITLVPAGTRLATRGATSNGWVPVTCAGRSGWVSVAYFNVGGTGGTPPPSGSGRYITVTGTGGSGLRCRTAPVSGGIITVLGEGARVQTRGAASNGWIPVICAGRSGWVSAAYTLSDVSGGGSGTLWLDVNLSTQTMRVYRGNTLIRSSLVSTGKPGFRTPTGTFYVNRKLPTRTMTGVLGGEYYYVSNVPWVMYFTNVGHAIHGAYWHNSFGSVRSHGCINLPVATANWLYSITPIGTRLRIHY